MGAGDTNSLDRATGNYNHPSRVFTSKLCQARGIQEKLRKADKSSSETLRQRVNLAGSGMGEFERFHSGRFE